jgi:hypothetical protein
MRIHAFRQAFFKIERAIEMWDLTAPRTASSQPQTMSRRIEVRYESERRAWKATLLSEREHSAYGSDARDAFEYLCEVLQLTHLTWRVVTASKDRVLYGEVSPTEPSQEHR